jgi:uncharacterized membrane protein YcaP (DUF421 family)
MKAFEAVDWAGVFVPNTPLLEIFVRGTLTYLALFALLRFVLRRQSGTLGITDMLVIVLIADAAQNAMSGGYNSVPEGVLLVAVIIGWSYAIDWLGSKWPAFGRVVHPPPLLLVKDGKMLRRNMREELVTPDELMSLIREQGVEHLSKVRRARMEGDGSVSVIEFDEKHQKPREKRT